MGGYSALATEETPGLVVYLLDVSASMAQPIGGHRRIDAVMGALMAAVRQMAVCSAEGARLAPRYRIAMIAYSDQTYDLLGGVWSIDQVARLGIPDLSPQRTTDTASAFDAALRLLEGELPHLQACPAPVVCHLTDGEYTGADPEPTVRRVMKLSVADGPVLVEHILFAGAPRVGDIRSWPGILPDTPLDGEYAQALRSIASPLPESYRERLRHSGFQLAPGALMLFPGSHPDMLCLGFQTPAPVR